MRSAFKQRIATVEKSAEAEQPPFLVEVTLDGRRAALLFGSVSGRLTETEFEISGAFFDLFLRRADWTG
jgi:hypothetical protein